MKNTSPLALFPLLMLFFAWILLLPFQLTAQNDLRQDQAFFNAQKATYQKWLDHAGLGKTLKVQAVEIHSNELALYLAFPFSNADSVTMAWWQLKKDFEAHSDLTLEQQLFYKMTHIMELCQGLGNVQLFDTYDTRREPCFYRGIHFSEDSVKVDSLGCMSKIREIDFDPSDFSHLKRIASFDWNSGAIGNRSLTPEEIRQRYPKHVVFNLIEKFAVQRFTAKKCELRHPEVHVLERKKVLRFEVTDLCKEVLSGENPGMCRLLRALGYDCNWAKREKLVFTFTYKDTPEGFTLNCTLDGLVGSGFYHEVRRGGYINMEIDFDAELEFYADIFKEEIREHLKNSY